MKNFQSLMRFAILLLVLGALPSHAQLTPSDDSYIDTTKPTASNGTKVTLGVISPSQTAYVRFDLSSIPAGYTSANIAKASLKVYVNAVTTAGSFNVDFVNGTWTEGTLAADNVPALGTTIAASVPLTKAQVHDYVVIDVTAALQAWLDGTEANDGLALVANSPLSATFDSKESTTQSHPPELDIVFTSSGGGSITGINTAAGSGLIGGGTSGTLNLSLTNTCANKQVLQWNGSSWVCANLSGAGTVTSVGLSAPASDFTVSGSPVTTAGTLGLNWIVAPTSTNTANAIVKRDASGSFNAGIINAATTSTTSAVTATSSSSSLGAIAIHGFDTNTANTFTVAVQGNSPATAIARCALTVALASALISARAAHAQTESVLHSFTTDTYGYNPFSRSHPIFARAAKFPYYGRQSGWSAMRKLKTASGHSCEITGVKFRRSAKSLL